jgi:hypothetical protein
MSVPIATPGRTSAAPTAAAGHKGAHKSGGAGQQSSQQITNQTTTTNADGSTVTVTTYADGTTSTTTQPASSGSPKAQTARQPPSGPGFKGGLLDTSNLGQNGTLLSAQERALAAA